MRHGQCPHAVAGLLALHLLPTPGRTSSPAGSAQVRAGIEVERLDANGALFRAGLRPDDVLHRWRIAESHASGPSAAGHLQSVLDWGWLELEQAAPLRLEGRRGGRVLEVRVGPGPWRVTVRPVFGGAWREPYRRAVQRAAAGQTAAASALWNELAVAAEERDHRTLAAWLHWRTAVAWRADAQPDRAVAALQQAVRTARDVGAQALMLRALAQAYDDAGQLDAAAETWRHALAAVERARGRGLAWADTRYRLGRLALQRGDLDSAESHLASALARQRRLARSDLAVAQTLAALGDVAFERGDLDAAAAQHEDALDLRRRHAPDSLATAASRNALGRIAFERSDLQAARQHFAAALALRQGLAPDSLRVAGSYNNLGLVAHELGDLDDAHAAYERCLRIIERLDNSERYLPSVLVNLGNVAADRGELDRAKDYYERALAAEERTAPDSVGVAATLNNLGLVAYDQGDLDLAVDTYSRALRIQQKLAPGSVDVALSLNNLGLVALERDAWDAATDYFERARAIQVEHAPDSLDLAGTVDNLGVVAFERGQLARAERYHRDALRLRERLAPESLYTASSLVNLGTVLAARQRHDAALPLLRRAAAIRERLAPGSSELALALQARGEVLRNIGRRRQAVATLTRAVEALEQQVGKLGGSQRLRAEFRARHAGLFQTLLGLLLDSGQTHEAFELFERWRARSLLAMLAERPLALEAALPEDVQKGRRQLAWRSYRVQQALADLDPRREAGAIAAHHKTLRQLRREREAFAERLRRVNPRLAALHYPKPLDARGARAALDPGTLLLAYAVGDERTHLFVLSRARPLRVVSLPIGDAALEREVRRLRALVQQVRGRVPQLGSLIVAARRLYDVLLAPVDSEIESAERLLIVADGALHVLPFAALVRPATGERRERYLAADKPIRYVQSATLHAELRRLRPAACSARGPALVAFGDPHYPASAGAANPGALYARRRELAPLPASRVEVERIAAAYGRGALTFLGREAREATVRRYAPSARYLHFATHGLLDAQLPLSSGLALSDPEQVDDPFDNGLLQTWEIFEQLRLRAELVVLSGCDTGLGEELRGEGLVGMARAFLFAGARSVVASLWAVGDQSTAEMMVLFYAHLQAGLAKDAALRAAQRDVMGDADPMTAVPPYHWAAFSLVGDYR